MRENPYKRLPPIECKQDGSLYRMTPAQRKQANALIRQECCCYEDGNCMLLDDGDIHTCPQTISFSVCCKWFRWSVLPQSGTLEAEIFRGKDLKCCEVCGGVFQRWHAPRTSGHFVPKWLVAVLPLPGYSFSDGHSVFKV